jgi:hypothetical protein
MKILDLILSAIAGLLIGNMVYQYTHFEGLALTVGGLTAFIFLFQLLTINLLYDICQALPSTKPKEKLETDLESQINKRWD